MTKRTTTNLTAEVCLYGNREIGFSYLAMGRDDDRPFGPYNPVSGVMNFHSVTEAVWMAAQEIRDRGIDGTVRIFAPGGQRYSDAPITSVPAFGDLTWKNA